MPRKKMIQRIAAISIALAAVSCAAPAPLENGHVANPPAGKLDGVAEGNLRVLKGIPYAWPPVGDARWKAPAPMPRWDGVRPATEFGLACVSPKPLATSIYSAAPLPSSEDC